jgi:hypothetical protein
MKTIDDFGTFNDAIQKSSPAVRKLAKSLRALISKVYHDSIEVPWPRLRVIGYGIGPNKSTEHFCYIAPYRTHVNLGFNHGMDLVDPDGLLEGKGKNFRHVKIKKTADVKRPALRRLLHQAVRERRQAIGS